MCGIGGIFAFEKNNSTRYEHAIKIISEQLTHRGPDCQNIIQTDNCFLTHTRLKIIDLNDSANQPMVCYQNRYTIIFNGEIYNYKDLKLDLQRASFNSNNKPYPFTTQSDTEVILAAYYRWGKDCVQYLDGMFAFAIYDNINKELFIARDRFGKKFIYYTLQPDFFAFASELTPLLKSKLIDAKINSDQLYNYFLYQTTFAPYTLIKDVYLLEAGCSALIKAGVAIQKNRYYSLPKDTFTTKDFSYDETKKQLRTLLFNAVEKRLISDVPLGAFLSGGIDSSTIVGIMRQISSNKIDTFHVTSNQKEFTESNYAKKLSQIYNTNHHDILLDEQKFLDLVPEALSKMDYPSGDGINTYIVSKYTKQSGITVALSGLGGDELFAGYPQFKILSSLHYKKWLDIPFVRKNIFQILPKDLFHSAYRLKLLMNSSSLDIKNTIDNYRSVFSELNVPLKTKHATLFFDTQLYEYMLQKNHLLSFISAYEMNTYMQNILLRDTDQMSMAVALEVRVPFLDYRLAECVMSVPDEYKYPHTPKKLLTDTLSDILPKEIIDRKKMGFVLPWKKWMNTHLHSFCDEKIKKLAQADFIDNKKLLYQWKSFNTHRNDRWWMFWHLIVLQNWIEKNNIKTV